MTLLDLAPWLMAGLLVAGLLHGLLPRDFISRHLGTSRFVGVAKAVALGVPMPLCSCGVIPAALGIKKQGANDGAAVGFLISTPQTGVDSIFVSAAFLGWPFALFKVISAVVTGLVGGAVTQLTADASGETVNERELPVERHAGLKGMLAYAINDLLYMIWKWILIGILVSAAISTWVPKDYFANTVFGHGPLALLLVLVISLPLYVCATSSVPIAASLVAAGMPPGAALVFLMAGPASNVATLGAVYRGFGLRVLVIYLATITLGSLGLGYAFDFILAVRAQPQQDHLHQIHWLSVLSAVALLAIMAWFLVRDTRRWWRRHRDARARGDLNMRVKGMTCQGCVRRVETALSQQTGVSDVAVDLTSGIALVRGQELDMEQLEQAVKQVGFDVVRH